jgi:ferredoxin-NADP reductase
MAEKVATVRSIGTIAPEVLVIDATPAEPAALAWRAGQFLSIRTGPGTERRSYSIASLASSGKIELLVKLITHGAGSDYFRALQVGDSLHFTGPMGFFVADLAHAGDAVFAVTGSGIAAALPIAQETLLRPQEQGRVRLYWGMRDESELYWAGACATRARSTGSTAWRPSSVTTRASRSTSASRARRTPGKGPTGASTGTSSVRWPRTTAPSSISSGTATWCATSSRR